MSKTFYISENPLPVHGVQISLTELEGRGVCFIVDMAVMDTEFKDFMQLLKKFADQQVVARQNFEAKPVRGFLGYKMKK